MGQAGTMSIARAERSPEGQAGHGSAPLVGLTFFWWTVIVLEWTAIWPR